MNEVKMTGSIEKIKPKNNNVKIAKVSLKVFQDEIKYSIFRVSCENLLFDELMKNFSVGDFIFVSGELRSSRFLYGEQFRYSIEIIAKEIKKVSREN